MKYFIHLFVAVLLISSVVPSMLYAQNGSTPGGIGGSTPGRCEGICLDNPLGEDSTITKLIEAILDILLVFAVPVIVFFIILAGFNYVTARGDTGKIEKAHMALLYALIGGVLILGARVLIDVIGGTIDSITG
jgi:hypothetical protein